MSLYA